MRWSVTTTTSSPTCQILRADCLGSTMRSRWHCTASVPLASEMRGLLDWLVGGVGLRRGRRDPDTLQVGEALDFWRVEELIPGRLLRLRAEM
jgi:hypothetical protein